MKFLISATVIFITCFLNLEILGQDIELEPIVIKKVKSVFFRKFGQDLSKDELEFFSIVSPEEISDYFSVVELKKRAPFGIQQDLSIRGSIFEDNTIQIEGIKINNSQTGHFSLELPVTAADIKKIEIDKNRQQLQYKLNQPKEKGNLIRSSFGQHALWENLLSSNFSLGQIKNRVSVEHKISSGSRSDTDFEIYNFSFHSLWQKPDKEVEFFFGSTKKDFGANSFYSQDFPQEEEHTTQRFFLLQAKLKKRLLDIESAAYLRRHTDQFILNRHDPSFYTNSHKTYIYGVENEIIFKNDLFLGLNLRKEEITSTNLGNHSRINKGFSFGIKKKKRGRFVYQGSGGLDYYKSWGYRENINFNLGFKLRDNLLIDFSYNRLWRAPSFTELYYNSPSNIGNPFLGLQGSDNYQIGLKLVPAQAIKLSFDIFLREQSDTIDWVKNKSSNSWKAENIGSLKARGFDFYGELNWGRGLLKRMGLRYTYLDLVKENNFNFSKYVFDYNQHKIITNFGFNFFEINSNIVINFSKPISRQQYTTVDLKLSKQFADFQISLAGTNIFNQDYQEKAGIKGAGRWYKLSITHHF